MISVIIRKIVIATFIAMLCRLVAILLILSVSLSNLTRCVVYTSYKLNQNYISSVLCVNKDKPKMQCKGSCYLSKKLKQAEEKEKSEQQSQKKQYEEVAVLYKQDIKTPEVGITISYADELTSKPSDYSSVFFQPPRVSSRILHQ